MQEAIDRIPVVRLVRGMMKGAFRTNPATGKVYYTKMSTAFNGSFFFLVHVYVFSCISHIFLSPPPPSNMAGFFDESPHVVINLGSSSNAKTYWQMMNEHAFGELTTSVCLFDSLCVFCLLCTRTHNTHTCTYAHTHTWARIYARTRT